MESNLSASRVSADQEILLSVAAAWQHIERQMDAALSNIKGISFSEYQLLRALHSAPGQRSSRVALADAVSRTASGVTRALVPLEKVGYVRTTRSDRDARLALAELTSAGHELVTDATGVMNDLASQLLQRSPGITGDRDAFAGLLAELAGAR